MHTYGKQLGLGKCKSVRVGVLGCWDDGWISSFLFSNFYALAFLLGVIWQSENEWTHGNKNEERETGRRMHLNCLIECCSSTAERRAWTRSTCMTHAHREARPATPRRCLSWKTLLRILSDMVTSVLVYSLKPNYKKRQVIDHQRE